jgi:hypothetical protein
MYPSHQYPSHQWPPPGPVYNYPVQRPRPKYTQADKWVFGIIAVLAAMVVIGGIGWYGLTSWLVNTFPDYSQDELNFLSDVHASEFTSWPSDKELVREGHELCAWDTKMLSPSHSSRGWSLPPDLLQRYSEKQLLSLDMRADHRLCSPFSGEDPAYPY